MFGLMYLLAFGGYLLISIAVVLWALRYARTKGKSAKRWGWSAALVMYLIPFWDWLPTLAVHQYYCTTEAGFWVFKTLDQWKAENPGVMETLVANKGAPSRSKLFDEGRRRTTTYLLNERFNWIVTQQDLSAVFPIIRSELEVIDVKRNEVVARYVDFGTGNSVKNTIGPPGPLKFWMHNGHCNGGDRNDGLMSSFTHSVRGAER